MLLQVALDFVVEEDVEQDHEGRECLGDVGFPQSEELVAEMLGVELDLRN